MDDLISREALLEEIGQHPEMDGNQRAAQILECILNAAAVDAVPVVHGRWEIVEAYGKTALYRCTACKTKMVDYTAREAYHRYCHVCGARMDMPEGKEAQA